MDVSWRGESHQALIMSFLHTPHSPPFPGHPSSPHTYTHTHSTHSTLLVHVLPHNKPDKIGQAFLEPYVAFKIIAQLHTYSCTHKQTDTSGSTIKTLLVYLFIRFTLVGRVFQPPTIKRANNLQLHTIIHTQIICSSSSLLLSNITCQITQHQPSR